MHRRILPVFLILSVAFLSETAFSQVLNVESVRADADREPGWAGELRFNGSLNKYRDRILKLGNATNAAYFSRRHTYLLLNSIDLVNIDGSSVVSNGHFHLRGTFFRAGPWSPELFTQFQYNANLGMNGRFLAGGGMRYTFLDREDISGHISTGLMFEKERWDRQDESTLQTDLLKSTSNVVIRGNINPQTQLLLIGYYQARPDSYFEPRIISENQLNIRMGNRITFAVSFVLNYDSSPVIDIPELTYELKNGIVISL